MNTSPLSPVSNTQSLEKRAYEAIKSAVLSFQLAPGESLAETDLARQLGISKTPVRDALSRLEKEGFVEKIPYKGYTVTPISKASVVEIFEVRAALEGLAARQATPRFDAKCLSAARLLVDEHQAAIDQQDLQSAARLNKQFHEMILRAAGNQWLTQILANLDEHLQRYRLLSNFQSGRPGKSAAEHRLIWQALADGNADAAEQSVRAHLLSVLHDLEAQDFNELVRSARQASHPQAHE